MLKPANYDFFFLFCVVLTYITVQMECWCYVSPEGEHGALRGSARKGYQTEIRSFMYIYKYINSYTVGRARGNGTALGF